MGSLGSVRFSVRLVTALAIAAMLLPVAAQPAFADAPTDLLPDLQMTPIFGVSLQTTKKGYLLLRFGTLVDNVGDGPLVVRGSVRSGENMTRIVQRVWTSSGSYRKVVQPNAAMYFEPLGVHDHWHLKNFIAVHLAPLTPTDPPIQRLSRKIGFCLFDTDQMPADQRPPNSAPQTYHDCGTERATKVRMGISVGWGDAYQPWYQYQSIDVTGLPTAIYRLCAVVNPQALWLEMSPANNTQWIDIDLDTSAKTVSVVASGTTPCDSPAAA